MKKLLFILFLLVGTAVAVRETQTCPQDGATAHWTGSIQGGGVDRQCEYSHTYGNDMTGYHTHTFWALCGN
jgi:hypothetical protein